MNVKSASNGGFRWRMVSLLVACAVGAAVGRSAFSGADPTDAAEEALIEPGSTLPSVEVLDTLGQRLSLATVIMRTRPNFLVVMSARCHTCLGELASWQEEATANTALRPVVVVETEDSGYLAYVGRLIRPTYELYRIDARAMERLGALATPVAYQLEADGRVVSGAIGVRGVLELRGSWERTRR